MAKLLQKGQSPYKCQVDDKIRFISTLLCICVLVILCVTTLPDARAQENSSYSLFSSPIQEDNKIEITVVRNDSLVGYIDGYRHIGGTAISVKQLFDLIDYDYSYDQAQKRIYGKDRSSRWFLLNTVKNSIVIDTHEYEYNKQEVYPTENDIYADVSFLTKFFDFHLSLNISTLRMTIRLADARPVTVEPPPIPPIAEVIEKDEVVPPTEQAELAEEAASPSPVTKEILTIEQSKIIPPQEIHEISTNAETEQAAKKEFPPPDDFQPNIDNLLSFEIGIGKLVHDELISVYEEGDYYYFALSEFAEAMDFPIQVNPDNGTADGWFIKEDNSFSLNISEGKVVVAGKDIDFTKNEVFLFDGDIYMWIDLSNKIFPLNISVNYNAQLLSLAPDEKLPFQAKKERELKRAEIEQRKQRRNNNFTKLENDYSFKSTPMVDFSANMGYSRKHNGRAFFTPSFSAISSTDVGVMNLSTFINANEDEIVSGRVTGKRIDIDGNMPGGLTLLEIGDVSAIPTARVAGSNSGRGIKVSSYPFSRPTEFGSTLIIGDSLPGWEIELYVNGLLNNFLVVGDDGRYEFNDVPVFLGNNDVRILFYGPQGEIREETRSFVINDSVIRQGEFFYSMSVNERNRDLFKFGETDFTEGRAQYSSKYDYGLTDEITLTGGTTHIELDSEEEHTYQTIGLSTAIGDVVGNINVAQDLTEGGWTAELTAATNKLWDLNIRGNQKIFSHDYVSQTNENESDKLQSETTLTIGGSIDVPVISGLNYRLNTIHDRFLSTKHETTVQGRFNTSYRGISFTNSTKARFYQFQNNSDMQIDGNIAVRGKLNDVFVRANATYGIEPVTVFNRLDISGQKKINDEFDTQLKVEKSFIGDRTSVLSGLLNWNTGKYRLSNHVSLTSFGDLTMNTNLSFSLYQEPRSSDWIMQSKSLSGSGAVSTIAFLDANYNNIFDEGEEVLEEVTFLRSNIKKKANKNGVAVITDIGGSGQTDISVDTDSLDDELMIPTVKGYSVIGHAGVIQRVDFPIVESSEIDGTVYFLSENGREETVSGLTLHLITADGKKVGTTKTEFDGLYIFTKVLPGEFFIVVSDAELKSLGVAPEENIQIAIERGSDIYSGYDMILHRAPPPITLAEAQPEPEKEEVASAETPWPKDELDVAQQETPIPEEKEFTEGSLEDIAQKTALLPDDIKFGQNLYSLPDSRYRDLLVPKAYARYKKLLLDEIGKRFHVMNSMRQMYKSPSIRFGMDTRGAMASLQNKYRIVPLMMDENYIADRYGYTATNQDNIWQDRIDFIQSGIASVPLIGLHSVHDDRLKGYIVSLPRNFQQSGIDPVRDIEERLAAQKPWIMMGSKEPILHRGILQPAYSTSTNEEIEEILRTRNNLASLYQTGIRQVREKEMSFLMTPTHSEMDKYQTRTDLLLPEEYIRIRNEMISNKNTLQPVIRKREESAMLEQSPTRHIGYSAEDSMFDRYKYYQSYKNSRAILIESRRANINSTTTSLRHSNNPEEATEVKRLSSKDVEELFNAKRSLLEVYSPLGNTNYR